MQKLYELNILSLELSRKMLSIPKVCTDDMSARLSSTLTIPPLPPFSSFSARLSRRCCKYRCLAHRRQFPSSSPSPPPAASTPCRLPVCSSFLFLLPFVTSSPLGESLSDCYQQKRVVTINNCTVRNLRSLCVGLTEAWRKIYGRECGSNRDSFDLTRRQAAVFLCLGLFSMIHAGVATAESTGPLSKYLKRRQLYPLDSYIPPILLCRIQFKEVEGKLLAETPLYADARSLLRSGPLGSLRTDIRAIAQYALEAGNGKIASDAVEQCLRSLEDLDSLILRASRNDTSVTIDSMIAKLGTALNGLDNLLETVPTPILDKGKAILLNYSIDPETSFVDSK